MSRSRVLGPWPFSGSFAWFLTSLDAGTKVVWCGGILNTELSFCGSNLCSGALFVSSFRSEGPKAAFPPALFQSLKLVGAHLVVPRGKMTPEAWHHFVQ